MLLFPLITFNCKPDAVLLVAKLNRDEICKDPLCVHISAPAGNIFIVNPVSGGSLSNSLLLTISQCILLISYSWPCFSLNCNNVDVTTRTTNVPSQPRQDAEVALLNLSQYQLKLFPLTVTISWKKDESKSSSLASGFWFGLELCGCCLPFNPEESHEHHT